MFLLFISFLFFILLHNNDKKKKKKKKKLHNKVKVFLMISIKIIFIHYDKRKK
ncbi:hypothetical protein LY90DRAFT_152477 [Neocallimastix californiae]|uniref:Uncharacterized protein n=1 Tax=Neocallimastix californiae TaxID=1754190 RepID=A0A1Y2ES85_9FUNG|nr:hypothetical protein LY90DRAFT_152477 [Neocallimastix californiae]|eukprot:ORY74409.1 hypothetical protein LY90DRAFT_152477 [Neocallimastix californiae]